MCFLLINETSKYIFVLKRRRDTRKQIFSINLVEKVVFLVDKIKTEMYDKFVERINSGLYDGIFDKFNLLSYNGLPTSDKYKLFELLAR